MNNSMMTPKELYDLVKAGQLDELKAIIQQDKALVHTNTPFGSLLHVAADRGHLDVVRLLVENGADIHLKDGIVGGSPLRSAASGGHLDVVQYLHSAGSELDTSEPNFNPLFGAIYGGHFEVAQYLLDRGIDASVKYNGENMTDMDALAFAIEWGRTDIAELLRSHQ